MAPKKKYDDDITDDEDWKRDEIEYGRWTGQFDNAEDIENIAIHRTQQEIENRKWATGLYNGNEYLGCFEEELDGHAKPQSDTHETEPEKWVTVLYRAPVHGRSIVTKIGEIIARPNRKNDQVKSRIDIAEQIAGALY